jgi:hypothetical protein
LRAMVKAGTVNMYGVALETPIVLTIRYQTRNNTAPPITDVPNKFSINAMVHTTCSMPAKPLIIKSISANNTAPSMNMLDTTIRPS